MKTGYFANERNYEGMRKISIALYPPRGWHGEQCKWLMPSSVLLNNYKTGRCSKEEYERIFHKQLELIDADKLFDVLGNNTVLLCYEKPGAFCHRRIVAAWFEEQLGIKVEEA